MFFIVKYIENDASDPKQEEENNCRKDLSDVKNKILLVNPDCPIGIIRDYIAQELLLNIEEKDTFDLCTEKGILIKTNQVLPVVNGMELLKEKETYYVIISPINIAESPEKTVLLIPLLNPLSKEYIDFLSQQTRRSSIRSRRSTLSKSSSKTPISLPGSKTKTSE